MKKNIKTKEDLITLFELICIRDYFTLVKDGESISDKAWDFIEQLGDLGILEIQDPLLVSHIVYKINTKLGIK